MIIHYDHQKTSDLFEEISHLQITMQKYITLSMCYTQIKLMKNEAYNTNPRFRYIRDPIKLGGSRAMWKDKNEGIYMI